MSKEEFGEHSRRNDGQDGDQRPFKKARYVWQLKGKYHLKKHFKSADTSGPSRSENNNNEPQNFNNNNNEQENNNNVPENNNNEEESNNNNVCQSMCCITSFRGSSVPDREVDQEVSSSNTPERSALEEIPVSLVQAPKNKDTLLYKWQARQVAKSVVDNTINSILEHCKLAPFDASDIIDNCENGEQVEDEGIMMAIQSHGLQSSTSSGLFPSLYEPGLVTSSTTEESAQSFKRLQNHEESTQDNLENAQNEIVKQSSSAEVAECDSTVENLPEEDDSITMEDPNDFLSAAVSVAIQKKGLSSYNYG